MTSSEQARTHPAYLAALAADEAFEALLVEVYGPKLAQDARYRTPFQHAGLRAAYRAKLAADEAWLQVMREGAIQRHEAKTGGSQ